MLVDGASLVFGGTTPEQVFADVYSPKQVELHSGASYPTRWITIHNTAKDGTADFDCNATARTAGATPFKRPENGTFKPDGKFRTFYFAITGDTNSLSGSVPEVGNGARRVGWPLRTGSEPAPGPGTIKLIVLGDAVHNTVRQRHLRRQPNAPSRRRTAAEHPARSAERPRPSMGKPPSLTALGSPLRVLAQGRTQRFGGRREDNEPPGSMSPTGG